MANRSGYPQTIIDAHQRITNIVRDTALKRCSLFSELSGANVYFKYENLQRTGSFKLRGAANRILALPPERRQAAVVTASTGNHGRAVATVANLTGQVARIFVPENADKSKLRQISLLGADIEAAGSDCLDAEQAARQFALRHDAVYISPYNDPLVVAGQGTIGLEICEKLDSIDAVFASLGGGGLISGVASCIQSQFPECQFYGCSPVNSQVMIESLAAGRLLDLPSQETLADGSAGGVESGSITYELCRQYVDHSVTVTEQQIAENLLRFIDLHNLLIEGAAAAAIAGMMARRDDVVGSNVVVILCGANIGVDKIKQAIDLCR